MRILIFSAGFFPGKKCGGPPVSVDNFCSLMNDFDCYIVASDHDMGETKKYDNIIDGWNNRGNSKVIYLNDKEFKSYHKITKIVDEIKPDWIYFQSLFQSCVFPGLMLAKRRKIRVLLAPRGELCKGAFKKKYKKIPYIRLINLLGLFRQVDFQSTSDEEKNAIHDVLRVQENRIHPLTNIPSIPRVQYLHNKKEVGVGRFVFISRIHSKKNLIFALLCLKEAKGEVVFDIYGPKEDLSYWTECEKVIDSLPQNVHVKYCGLVNHDDVHEVFSSYDAFLFPTFSENFGHVIAESMLVGTPVIISDQTPWTDINDYNAGWAFNLSNKHSFIEAINELIFADDEKLNKMRSNINLYIENRFKLSELHNMYFNVFKK